MSNDYALDNIRVAAFTHFAAGPIAAQYLGALGADVIKVESPTRDLNRYAVRDANDSLGSVSPYFVCTNRNQKDIVVNLKSKEGIEVAMRLVAGCDVILENYRPGVMDKLGLGYSQIRRVKDNIVYCSFSAYDALGPYRDKPGQDLLLQAASGLASLSGSSSGPPVPVGAYVIDGFTAMQGVIGILSALSYRDRTGKGQWVRADMMSTAMYMMKQEASFAMNAETMTTRSSAGIAHVNQAAPYGIYESKNGALAISVFGGVESVQKLAVAFDIEAIVSKYLTERGLKVHRDEIASEFAKKIRDMTLSDAIATITNTGAWAAPVRTLHQAIKDPSVQAAGIIQHYDTKHVGQHSAVTEPLMMSETPLRRDIPAPAFGQDTVKVLLELGYSEGEVEYLVESGVVSTET